MRTILRVVALLVVFFVMWLAASIVPTSISKAEGDCDASVTVEDNVATVTISQGSADYSCSVDFGDGSSFEGPNSGGSQYSYEHGYSYTDGEVTKYKITINGQSHDVVLDYTGTSGSVYNGGQDGRPEPPQPMTWCAVNAETLAFSFPDAGVPNRIVGSVATMGGQKDFLEIVFGDSAQFVPTADFNGVVSFDHSYSMDGDAVYAGMGVNRNTGQPCFGFVVNITGGVVTVTWDGGSIASGALPAVDHPAPVAEAPLEEQAVVTDAPMVEQPTDAPAVEPVSEEEPHWFIELMGDRYVSRHTLMSGYRDIGLCARATDVTISVDGRTVTYVLDGSAGQTSGYGKPMIAECVAS